MRIGRDCHLTYCTNIHPGESWPEVRENLRRYLPAIKRAVAPDTAFGVGLRLSAAAAEALDAPEAMAELGDFLAREGLYVFTINGFPYGTFHHARVKEDVYLPDWLDERRLGYTDRLADILARLLPAGVEGSISTVPGAFKPRARTEADAARMAALMARHAAHLIRIKARTGRSICLALEPEPCCFLETIDEAVAFFNAHLFGSAAVAELATRTGLDRAGAERALRHHVGVCLDLCHAAIEFEDPDDAAARLQAAGIRIAKLQLSAGLRIDDPALGAADALKAFDDGVYLHQVVSRSGAELTRYVDLPDAMAALSRGNGGAEWRIHFHVPIFLEDLGTFSTTQAFLRAVLQRQRREPISQHLEVETYTWGVLPPQYQGADVAAAITTELEWVKRELAA